MGERKGNGREEEERGGGRGGGEGRGQRAEGGMWCCVPLVSYDLRAQSFVCEFFCAGTNLYPQHTSCITQSSKL
jgi:hypothetical protein